MPMIINPSLLDPKTLDNVLSETILQEGIDYGLHEISLAKKMDALRAKIERQEVVLVYDEGEQTCRLCPADEVTL